MPPPRTYTLTAPAQVLIGDSFDVTGTGYDPKLQTWIRVLTDTTSGWYSATTNPDGTIVARVSLPEAGDADIASFQDDGRKSRRPKGTPTLATCTVVAV